MTGIERIAAERKRQIEEWAAWFKKNHKCVSCPFVIDEVDIGVGIQRNCGIVCRMEIDDIVNEMEGYGVAI
jgi:hypothetical protein